MADITVPVVRLIHTNGEVATREELTNMIRHGSYPNLFDGVEAIMPTSFKFGEDGLIYSITYGSQGTMIVAE